jgi:succinoglycan biosynthesis transport protein ExoP
MASDPNAQFQDDFQLQPEREEEFHLSQWIDVLRRRLRLLIVVALAAIAVSVAKYFVTPKEYRASCIVQIERRTPAVFSVENLLNYDTWADAQSFYPTQYRLLQSRGLAERVVRALRLHSDPVFNPHRGLLAGGSSTTSATAADDAAAIAGLAGRVVGGLEITPIRNTRLVEVSYRAPTGELAARVANGLADVFIDWNVESRYETTNRASSFLASQTETLKQEIQDKESQLQAYSLRSDIVALDPASNVTLQRLEALNRDYIAAVSERIQKEARYKELSSTPSDSVAEEAGGLVVQIRGEVAKLERDYANKLSTFKPEWPAMQELKAQIDKGRSNLASTIEETAGKVRDSSRTEYQTALRKEQSLENELAKQKSEAMRLNSRAVEYNNLKVEISTRRSLLDELLRKQSATEVASRMTGNRESNVLIVDRALVPRAPFRPSLQRNLMLGLAIGLGLGLGLVFFVEYLDRTIKTPEDVDRLLKLPILAMVPDLSGGGKTSGYGYSRSGYGYGYGYGASHSSARRAKGGSKKDKGGKSAEGDGERAIIELVPHTRPRVIAAEASRTLRTSLLLSSAGGLKTVAVTSAIPGEGKTATSINLSVVLAQLGGEVLFISADLRKPRGHEIFGISNRVGLVNYLAGGTEIDNVIIPTNIPNLFVTPAGPTPPNPSELLASDRMLQFGALVRQRFAYVVYDTPPIIAVTDALIIGAQTDGVVFCVGAGQVLREDAIASRDRLAMAGVRVLGVVLNRFHPQGKRYGRRYHYYEYEAYGEDGERPSRGRVA